MLRILVKQISKVGSTRSCRIRLLFLPLVGFVIVLRLSGSTYIKNVAKQNHAREYCVTTSNMFDNYFKKIEITCDLSSRDVHARFEVLLTVLFFWVGRVFQVYLVWILNSSRIWKKIQEKRAALLR